MIEAAQHPSALLMLRRPSRGNCPNSGKLRKSLSCTGSRLDMPNVIMRQGEEVMCTNHNIIVVRGRCCFGLSAEFMKAREKASECKFCASFAPGAEFMNRA
jgi:hypothetical protein